MIAGIIFGDKAEEEDRNDLAHTTKELKPTIHRIFRDGHVTGEYADAPDKWLLSHAYYVKNIEEAYGIDQRNLIEKGLPTRMSWREADSHTTQYEAHLYSGRENSARFNSGIDEDAAQAQAAKSSGRKKRKLLLPTRAQPKRVKKE